MLENSSLPQPQIAREKQKSGTGKSLAVRKPFIHFQASQKVHPGEKPCEQAISNFSKI